MAKDRAILAQLDATAERGVRPERAKAALTRGDPAQAACAAAAARSFAALGLQQLQYAPYRTNSGDQP